MSQKSLRTPVRFYSKDSAWYVCPSRFDHSESPPTSHPDYVEDRKFIYVPAVPSSGTSALCAVLLMLGVNMGQFPTQPNAARGYVTYEDMDYNLFRWEIQGPQNRLMRLRIRFRDYLNYRFVKTPDGPVGAKGLPLYFVQDEDPISLPIVTIDIERPLTDAIIADFRTVLGAPDRDPEQQHRSLYDHWSRGGAIGACWLAKQTMFEMFPPVMRIKYYEMLEKPEEHVTKLVEALDLEVTDTQLADAIRVIRPEARHI